jgi:hypothetical protein
MSAGAEFGGDRGALAPILDPVRPIGAATLLALVGVLAFLAAGSVAARQEAVPVATTAAPVATTAAPAAATPDWMLDGYGAMPACHPATGEASAAAAS